MIFDIFSVIGWIGTVLILTAYFMLSTKRIKPHSMAYNSLNLAGGITLAVSTIATKSWPSVILNIIWAGIAIFSIRNILNTKPVYKQLRVRGE